VPRSELQHARENLRRARRLAVGSAFAAARSMIHRCTFCASTAIRVSGNGRILCVVCATCEAVFVVEFDPPDAPGIRGRIEALHVPVPDWTVH
jgi:hypothetical protein